MERDFLIKRFKEETTGKNYAKADKVLRNDLVSSVNITEEECLICINANVISENLFSEYKTKIEIDTRTKSILSTSCTCKDYEKHELTRNNYCCKHLIAAFFKSLDKLLEQEWFKEEEEKTIVFKKDEGILWSLIDNEKDKEELKLQVYLNREEWSGKISAEFKIGLKNANANKLYVVKDIDQFLISIDNNIPIKYGQNFMFNIKKQYFSVLDRNLLEFIRFIKSIDINARSVYRSFSKNVDGKLLRIPNDLLRDFFEKIKYHRVYLNEGFFYRTVETEILNAEPDIDFNLKFWKDEFSLKTKNGMPQKIGTKGDVFLYGTSIYIPSYDFCYKVEPYLEAFSKMKAISIPKENESIVLNRLIPRLHELSNNVLLSQNILKKVVIEDVLFNFYFDKDNNSVKLTLKVKYGEYEFNIFDDFKEKIIYRDYLKEKKVISELRNLGFEEVNHMFYFIYGDDYVFNFFKNKINILQDIGNVYYSDSFKGIKNIGAKGIKGSIKKGKFNYFEMTFKIDNVDKSETKDILRAFRDNVKYYKLKSGEFIDLEEIELKNFLKLIDSVAPNDLDDDMISIHKNKAIFLNNFIEENDLKFIKGKSNLKEIVDKFKNIDKIKFKEPKELNATLREYQKVGYNWLNTLHYLGLGGILGDEMGLGKTLQTITFIAANKGTKTLIVAPTSLIYNWENEFLKFSKETKVALLNGTKEERYSIIDNLNSYDVLITTYNLLKRDIDKYKEIEFTYCILDEAQYIKNASSQNAMCVKTINAKTRFALSGTPIENSLMELWSIFDFVMPGYLYDEKRFSVRYEKRLSESPEVLQDLNRLIKPFILRRKKKDVIKELPQKIEKRIAVALDDEQKKVYISFAKHVTEIIEKKVKDDEFKNSKIEILSYITKLRQLCIHPSLLMNDYKFGSGKIEALVEILSQSIQNGHKILVFSGFTSALKLIKKRLDEEQISCSYLDGSIPSKDRMPIVKEFNEGDTNVFLISLKAGGSGLNLTSADVVVHFDPWWNPAVEEQATDRAHRIGQKNVVEVIKLIARGTIEEKIISLQDEKKALISKLMDGDFGNEDSLLKLSDSDLLNLFKIEDY